MGSRAGELVAGAWPLTRVAAPTQPLGMPGPCSEPLPAWCPLPRAHSHAPASPSAPAHVVPPPPPQLVGMPYLHEVLKPVISRVFEEKKYIELDPCKMDLSRTK